MSDSPTPGPVAYPLCGHARAGAAGECPLCLLRLTLEPPAAAPTGEPTFPGLDVLGPLGRGGMGVVYKARQRALDRVVAVKCLVPEKAADPAVAERFLREARALARLNHPHIVSVYDSGRAGDVVYLVMEYVDGETLRHRLNEGRLAPTDALRLVPLLCDALQYAHDRGVVHRDIKPENVLLGHNGDVKVADFGLAKLAAGPGDPLTDSGERMGTARYMAPEQWRDTAAVDHRADIYSLGVLFYEMLTGDVPTPQYRPPSEKAGTDRRLDGVVARSLREEPDERYQKADEVKTDVVRIARGRRGWVGFAAVAVAIAAIVATAVWPRGNPNASMTPPTPATPAETTPDPPFTSPDWAWAPPENLGPPVNTEHDELTPFLTDDGRTIYFASRRPGGLGDADLWLARRATPDGPFDPPTPVPGVNSDALDGAPCLTADGLTLAFHSRRNGRFGLFVSERTDAAAPWGPPRDFGPNLATDATDEFRPWLSADGLSVTFVSGRESSGGVWKASRTKRTDAFGPPRPFGRGISQQGLGGPAFTADGRTVMLNRSDNNFPGDLLWLGRVTSSDQPFRNLISFGPTVNAPAIDVDPVPHPDGKSVFFQSDRPGGQGGTDLWLARRVKKSAANP